MDFFLIGGLTRNNISRNDLTWPVEGYLESLVFHQTFANCNSLTFSF